MARFPLDLSKFHKISSDKTTTTMQHEDGHQLKLAHNALEPKQRALLMALKPKKMADGGEVADNPKLDESKKTPPTTSMRAAAKTEEAQMYAKGGKIKDPGQTYLLPGDNLNSKIEKKAVAQAHPRRNYDDGGPVEKNPTVFNGSDPQNDVMAPEASTDTPNSSQQPQEGSIAQLLGQDIRGGIGDAGKAMQSVVDPILKGAGDFTKGLLNIPPSKALDTQDSGTGGTDTSQPSTATPAQGLPSTPPAQAMAANGQVPPQNNTNPQQDNPLAQSQGMIQSAANALTAAPEVKQQALSDIAKAQQGALDTQAQEQQTILDKAKTIQGNINDEISNVSQEIHNGHIDPNHYWDNRSTGQKVGSAIGVFLAGIGGHGQGNMALDFINKQIDRDIQSQQSNQSNKLNLVGAMSKYLGDSAEGSKAASLILKNTTLDKMAQEANKLQDPVLRAQKLQELGQAKLALAPQIQQIGMTNALIKASGNGGEAAILPMMRVVNPDKAKEIETRLVPGAGPNGTDVTAKVPVPNEVRNSIVAKQQLDTATKDLYNWAANHTGSLNPKDIAVGKEKAQLLQSLYREGVLGTVYKAGEQPLLDKVVGSDPTSFFNTFTNLPKLKEVMESNQRQLNIQKSNYGIPVAQPQASQAAPQIAHMNGKPYQKNPADNKWYPVK